MTKEALNSVFQKYTALNELFAHFDEATNNVDRLVMCALAPKFRCLGECGLL